MMHEHPRQVSVFAVESMSSSSSPFRFHGMSRRNVGLDRPWPEHTSRIDDYNLYTAIFFLLISEENLLIIIGCFFFLTANFVTISYNFFLYLRSMKEGYIETKIRKLIISLNFVEFKMVLKLWSNTSVRTIHERKTMVYFLFFKWVWILRSFLHERDLDCMKRHLVRSTNEKGREKRNEERNGFTGSSFICKAFC